MNASEKHQTAFDARLSSALRERIAWLHLPHGFAARLVASLVPPPTPTHGDAVAVRRRPLLKVAALLAVMAGFALFAAWRGDVVRNVAALVLSRDEGAAASAEEVYAIEEPAPLEIAAEALPRAETIAVHEIGIAEAETIVHVNDQAPDSVVGEANALVGTRLSCHQVATSATHPIGVRSSPIAASITAREVSPVASISRETQKEQEGMNMISNAAAALAATFVAAATPSATWADDDYCTLSGGTLTFNVDASDPDYSYSGDLSGVTKIVKNGTGTANIGTATHAFTGTIDINGGYLAGYRAAFGNPTAINIAAKACLSLTDTPAEDQADDAKYLRNADVTIAGDGPDGLGAVRRAKTNKRIFRLFKSLALSGNATINCGSGWGFRTGTLNLGGNVLTVIPGDDPSGNPAFIFIWNTVTMMVDKARPGKIVIKNGAQLFIQGETFALASGSTGALSDVEVVVEDGATVIANNQTPAKAVPFTLRAQGDAILRISATANNNPTASHWAGPIFIDGTRLALTQENDGAVDSSHLLYNSYLDGGVIGGGNLYHAQTGNVILGGGAESVVGSVSQLRGRMTVADGASLSVTNGSILVQHTSMWWPSEMCVTNGGVVRCREGFSAPANMALDVGKSSGYYGVLELHKGSVVSNHVTLGESGSGAVYMHGGKFCLVGDDGKIGDKGNAFFGRNQYGQAYFSMHDGEYLDGCWMNIGTTDSRGFFVQRGGSARHLGGPLRIGRNGTGSYGHIYVCGGTFTTSRYVAMNMTGNLSYCGPTAVITVDGADATFDASATSVQVLTSTNHTKGVNTSIVNLNNGGTLKTRTMFRTVESDKGIDWAAAQEYASAEMGNPCYLNFNGGVFSVVKDAATQDAVGSRVQVPDRVTVYAGGAVIDTPDSNYVVNWHAPLLRPTGKSFKSIALPASRATSTAFIGPSRIRISSTGGGFGADALVDYDDFTKKQVGAIVTAPGNGYDEATTTVTVESADRKSTEACTFELEEAPATGGLVKRGPGTLQLTGVNTYGGATAVEGGILRFTVAGGLPAGNDIAVAAGATLDLNGLNDATVSRLSGAGHIVNGNITVTGTLALSASDIFADSTFTIRGSLTFAEGAAVTISDPENLSNYRKLGLKPALVATEGIFGSPVLSLDASVTEKWNLSFAHGNTTLRFGIPRGTMMVIR